MTRHLTARAMILVPTAALVFVALALGVLWADLAPDDRQQLGALLTAPRIGLLVLFAVALAGVLALIAYRLVAPMVAVQRRIAESVQLVAHGNPAHRLSLGEFSSLDLRAMADAINALAGERSKLLDDVATTVAEANARVDEERTRLAALISELEQSVLVCNRDGRVLLYNAAAEALLIDAGASGAGERLGLGRSVFGLIDRAVIQHALEAMECQGARDEREGAHFVTATPEGRLLRVRVAPVLAAGEEAKRRELTGYVLLLSDVTEDVDADAKRGALFQGLVESTRAALANIRAAIENLTEHPDMSTAQRAKFATIIRDESVMLSGRLHRVTAEVSDGLRERWPLAEMRGEDLLTLACNRIGRRAGMTTTIEPVLAEVWLNVDSFSIAQALTYVARRLKDEYGVREARLRLTEAAGHVSLDLMWRGPPMSSETAFTWQSEPLTQGGEDSPLTLAQVMERHGAEAWYQRDVPTQMAYFRFLLPLAEGSAGTRARPIASRPEFYDFDLFRRSPAADAFDERALDDLAYTVFDTETTGLNPSEGDQIIAIGAVRIVNGRLLRGETFASLVDPQRALPASSIAVHGITPEMLRGQPSIETVLPRFHRFAEDTVLVGHNAAFDMRFLQRNEARTQVRFEQPVLDTLLLSAVVHPAQRSHSLEEIAAQLGVEVVGRHTAQGDALITADVFLRLLPLLATRGILTLGDARAAAEKTFYARLEY